MESKLLIPFLCIEREPAGCDRCGKNVRTIVQMHDPEPDDYPCVHAFCKQCFVEEVYNDPRTDKWTVDDGLNGVVLQA